MSGGSMRGFAIVRRFAGVLCEEVSPDTARAILKKALAVCGKGRRREWDVFACGDFLELLLAPSGRVGCLRPAASGARFVLVRRKICSF
jgi:hypothetical protein